MTDLKREPRELGGLFASIHRANKELVARRTAILQRENPGLLDSGAREISQAVPPMYLGLIVAAMMQPHVCVTLAERNAGSAEVSSYRSSLQTMAAYFEAAIASLGETLYRELASWVLTRLFGYMVDELRQDAGPSGQWLAFGDFGHVRACYLRTRTGMEYQALYDRVLWSAVKTLAALLTQQFSLAARPAKALQWMLGQEASPDWLLASEAAVAAYRNDLDRLEQLRQEWGMPDSYRSERDHKMRYHAARFSGNPQDGRFSLALGLVATTSDQWHRAENPIGWLVAAAWRELRERQKADEMEHVQAGKEGFTAVTDLDGVDSAWTNVADAAVESVPELPDLPWDLWEELGEIRNAAAVRRVYDARRQGVKWDEICPADRSTFRRQKRTIGKLIAGEAIGRAAPELRHRHDASAGAYRQFFYEPDRRLQVWTHVHDRPEKLEALRHVLAQERIEWQREHKD